MTESTECKLTCFDCGKELTEETNHDGQCEKCNDASVESNAWHLSDFDGYPWGDDE